MLIELLWLSSSVRDAAMHDDRERRFRIRGYRSARQHDLWKLRKLSAERRSPLSFTIAWTAVVASVFGGVQIIRAGFVDGLESDQIGRHIAYASLLFALAIGAFVYRASLRTAARTLRAKLSHGAPVCLACAQNLDGLTPEHDGCLVCPECGHAWRSA